MSTRTELKFTSGTTTNADIAVNNLSVLWRHSITFTRSQKGGDNSADNLLTSCLE